MPLSSILLGSMCLIALAWSLKQLFRCVLEILEIN